MNRCLTFALTSAVAFLLLGSPASAQMSVRPFPVTAERGAMQITNPPEMVLNGKSERLSPGARVRGANNMLVMSASLSGQNLLVNFVREPQGLIHEVWVLTEAEAKVPLAPKP